MRIFRATASDETTITEIQRLVSAMTDRENRLVTLLSTPLLMKPPPKYLNKSKCEKMLNFKKAAPFAMKVKMMFTKYSPAEKQTAQTYDLKIVEIAIAMRENSQIFIIKSPI